MSETEEFQPPKNEPLDHDKAKAAAHHFKPHVDSVARLKQAAAQPAHGIGDKLKAAYWNWRIRGEIAESDSRYRDDLEKFSQRVDLFREISRSEAAQALYKNAQTVAETLGDTALSDELARVISMSPEDRAANGMGPGYKRLDLEAMLESAASTIVDHQHHWASVAAADSYPPPEIIKAYKLLGLDEQIPDIPRQTPDAHTANAHYAYPLAKYGLQATVEIRHKYGDQKIPPTLHIDFSPLKEEPSSDV